MGKGADRAGERGSWGELWGCDSGVGWVGGMGGSLVLGTWYQVLGTKYLVPSTW